MCIICIKTEYMVIFHWFEVDFWTFLNNKEIHAQLRYSYIELYQTWDLELQAEAEVDAGELASFIVEKWPSVTITTAAH